MSPGGGNNVHLSRQTPELLGARGCSGTIECAVAGAADELLLIGWLLLLLITAMASLVFLPRARELSQGERRRTRAEYDAFDRFITEVQAVAPTAAGTMVEPAGAGAIFQAQVEPTGGAAARVRGAYRDTVMDVPHFEEEYDETLEEHMSAELSDEIAHALAGGTLPSHIKDGVIAAARDARDRRADFLNIVDEECSSLERHAGELADLERTIDDVGSRLCADQSFDELRDNFERLESCTERIGGVVHQRQRDRMEGRNAVLRLNKDLDLQEYLYAPMEVTYPVLAESARLLSQARISARRIEDELIYRA